MVEIKLLKCPSCGSSELEKLEDKFCKCNHCGSKLYLNNNTLTSTSKEKKSNNSLTEVLANFIVVLIILAGASLVIGLIYFLFKFSYNLLYSDNNDPANQINKVESNIVIEKNQIENRPNIKVLSHVSGRTSNGHLYWVVQLMNSGISPLKDITASVSLFDENEIRIEEKKSWSLVKFLLPQQSTEVVISILNPPKKFAKVEINGYGKMIEENKINQLLLNVDQYFVKENKDKFDIIGDLTNSYGFVLDNINVVAVALDANGVPVGHGYKYATRISLPAQERTGFKVNVHTYLAKKPVSWKVYAIARKN